MSCETSCTRWEDHEDEVGRPRRWVWRLADEVREPVKEIRKPVDEIRELVDEARKLVHVV
jgi:hypothetical protein